MITKDNFWDTDLDKLEAVFLQKGNKVTDLPTYLNQVVPEQGSVLLGQVVDIDKVVGKPSLFSKIKSIFH